MKENPGRQFILVGFSIGNKVYGCLGASFSSTVHTNPIFASFSIRSASRWPRISPAWRWSASASCFRTSTPALNRAFIDDVFPALERQMNNIDEFCPFNRSVSSKDMLRLLVPTLFAVGSGSAYCPIAMIERVRAAGVDRGLSSCRSLRRLYITLLAQLRVDMRCRNKLVVVRDGDSFLRIPLSKRRRVKLTQRMSDQLVINEIVNFVNDVLTASTQRGVAAAVAPAAAVGATAAAAVTATAKASPAVLPSAVTPQSAASAPTTPAVPAAIQPSHFSPAPTAPPAALQPSSAPTEPPAALQPPSSASSPAESASRKFKRS